MTHPDPWPLAGLVLRTPRLELRPDDDAGLAELVEVAYTGVHPPEEMPFMTPWTDADPAYLGRGMLQHFWSQRAALTPERWAINFLVRHDGRVIGMQGLSGADFGIVREVSSGSWIGMAHHGRGFGTEMRLAVLLFAFDHLGAARARSDAFADNHASHRVSAKLGYRPNGSVTAARRGLPAEDVRLVLDAADLVRPSWTLGVDGVRGCLGLLQAGAG